jgi:putative copper export protein
MFLPVDALVLLLRALSFVAVLWAAGAAAFLLWLRGDASDATLARIRHLARAVAIAALCLAVAHFVLTPGRMGGDVGRSFDPSLESLLLRSHDGIANIVRVVGLALTFVCLDRATRANEIGAGVGAALTLLSFALTGHTSIHAARFALAPLLLAHLAVAAVWLGALWPLRWIVLAEPVARAAPLLERCARAFARAVPVLAVCGIVLAAVLVGSWRGLASVYGAFVLGKTLAFAALVGLTAFGTQRAASGLRAERGADTSGDGRGVSRFGRAAAREWVLLAAIAAGTAVMTSVAAPEHLGSAFGKDHAAEPAHD